MTFDREMPHSIWYELRFINNVFRSHSSQHDYFRSPNYTTFLRRIWILIKYRATFVIILPPTSQHFLSPLRVPLCFSNLNDKFYTRKSYAVFWTSLFQIVMKLSFGIHEHRCSCLQFDSATRLASTVLYSFIGCGSNGSLSCDGALDLAKLVLLDITKLG